MEQLIAEQKARELKIDKAQVVKDGMNIALPEKAFLDEIYVVARGKATLDFDELDVKKLSRETLKEFRKRFPPYAQRFLKELT